MRTAYVVTYDICEPKRLRRVYRIMLGYGDHLQYSVFRCELTARERVELEALLSAVMHHRQDQVLFIDLGPAEGRARTCIDSVGRAYDMEERRAVIV